MINMVNILNKIFKININKIEFYSLNGEDYLLWKFFDKKKEGFYIDVGAFDGRYFSNTFLFEKLGWEGVCIEPNSKVFKLLKKNRNKAINCNYACIDDENISSIVLNVENMGYLSTIDNSEEKKQDIITRYKKRGLVFEGLKKIDVNAITLNTILTKYNIKKKIDLLKIDVEDAELKVLKGFDLNKYQPRVIMLEANTNDFEKDLKEYLIDTGYIYVGRHIENIFFVLDKKDKIKMENIKINCTIKKQIHPLDPKFSIKDLLEGKKINSIIKN